MKLHPLVIQFSVLFFMAAFGANAQYACDSVRYMQEGLYAVDTTNNVHFGDNVSVPLGFPNNGSLEMDVYQPEGDTSNIRPVILLAFGGSFISGIKESPDIVELCERYTSMGYVCVSIDYRAGLFLPVDSVSTFTAVLRAVHDMKAAIRFIRKDAAENNNQWRIDTSRIIIGGVSAGAITAIQTAYISSLEELVAGFPFVDTVVVNGVGGLEGNSGNLGYSSKVHAVINLCGTIGDTLWIEGPNDPVIVSLHGSNDGTVPIGSGYIEVSGTATGLYVDGSASMKVRSDHIGHPHALYVWEGKGHTPFIGTGGGNLGQVIEPYMDTVVWFTRDFMYEEVVCKNNVVPTGIKETYKDVDVDIYPNPNNGEFVINCRGLSNQMVNIRVVNVIGEEVLTQFNLNTKRIPITLQESGTGYYFVEITDSKTGEILTVRTLVVE